MIEPRKLAGGWKILLPVRVQAIYGMHAATFLNPRTFPAVFVDSMPNHSKQGVRDTELEGLDYLHGVRGNDDAEIAQPGDLSAFQNRVTRVQTRESAPPGGVLHHTSVGEHASPAVL